jgi:glycosyltransferase involved in cell wall biosynthesis
MVRCVIVGDGESREWLTKLTKEYGLEDRVTFAGQVSEAELLDHLACCRAVCFPAIKEDYGLVTVEAFASQKAVITCADSGGPTELVRNETNGLVVEPTANALAIALARISEDSTLAESFGVAGLQQVTAMTWEQAVDRLLLV